MIYYPRALASLAFALEAELPAAALVIPKAWAAFEEALPATPLSSHRVTVLPRRMRIARNPYNQADTCSLSFDYRHFPFDPRIARAVAMECHIGDAGGLHEGFSPDAGDGQFIGQADSGDWRLSDGNEITIEARDQTALLIDLPWDGHRSDLQVPLDAMIADILAANEVTKAMGVELRGLDSVPVIATERGDSGQQMPGQTTGSTWDHIATLAAQAGLVAWVESNNVVIAASQVPSSLAEAPAMVYGSNLKSLIIQREFTRRQTPPVVLASYDPENRKTLRAVFPDAAPPSVTGQGQVRTENPVFFRLSNVNSQAALDRMARSIYRRRLRQDISLFFETSEMRGPGGEDLTKLKAGDALAIYMDPAERQYLHGQELDERRRYLETRGYAPGVAASIADGYERLAPFYVVAEAEHSFDADQGYTLRVKALSVIGD
ncbi:MAG: hypothetical protein GC208_10385 [Alphaproteobacteria bacterium]|nr:hypothetical protein [Alphaproteobacteria bacterium]